MRDNFLPSGDSAPDALQSVGVASPAEHELKPDSTVSRRRLLAMGAMAGAAGLAMGAKPANAFFGSNGGTEAQALRLVEELAELNKDFFVKATRFDFVGTNGRQSSVVNTIARQDDELHFYLKAALLKFKYADANGFFSPNTVASPTFRIFTYPTGLFDSLADTLVFGHMLKETTVQAYHGQIGNIQNPELIEAAAAFAGVQGRHAAMMAELVSKDPIPDAFQKTMTLTEVTNKLAPYGFTGGAMRTGY